MLTLAGIVTNGHVKTVVLTGVCLVNWSRTEGDIKVPIWERVNQLVKGKPVKMLTKVTKTITREQAIDHLKGLLKDYPRHWFIASHQWEQYCLTTRSLGRKTAVCVLDFAENYTCSLQDEVQSAYYSRNSVTIHPIVVTYKEHGNLIRDSVVFISDDLQHDGATVKAFVQGVSTDLQIKAPHKKTSYVVRRCHIAIQIQTAICEHYSEF